MLISRDTLKCLYAHLMIIYISTCLYTHHNMLICTLLCALMHILICLYTRFTMLIYTLYYTYMHNLICSYTPFNKPIYKF